jgi:transglutaminase-like putative cysteine protease
MRSATRVSRRFAPTRVLALLAAVGLLGTFTGVLYTFVDVAGDVEAFVVIVAATVVAGTLLASVLGARHAIAIALVVLVGGMGYYVLTLPYSPALWGFVDSNITLLSGGSIHQIRQSGTWAMTVAPTPIFACWYFALRRWYGTAALAGGTMLGYLVLTGDATTPVALVGVVAAAAMLAFGDFDRYGGSGTIAEYAAVALAIMVVAPLVISVVPAQAGSPAFAGATGGGGGGQSLETAVLADEERFRIQGSIRLSPAVRFTVESDADRYWKARSFDRYTGDGWALTGGSTPLARTELPRPRGPRRVVDQRVSVESALSTLPAAWRPTAVSDVAANVSITAEGDIAADRPLDAGETYRVVSAISTASARTLRADSADYAERIEDRYTGLPASTPDRLAERTADITAGAESVYDEATAVETWLEANREYSLDVDRPEGNVADAFLFEMERGYCTYYATTMVAMLRSQGIPARLATGYVTGQPVGDSRYVVRGLDAHVWVEVYFADAGWIAFDPTPAGPRRAVEGERIRAAREADEPNVDTNDSREATISQPATPTDDPSTGTTPALGPVGSANTSEFVPESPGSPIPLPDLPPREHLALGLVLLVGAAAGVRRTGLPDRLVRAGRVRFQRRRDPAIDVDTAVRRMELVLERTHRERAPGETYRQYLEAIGAPDPAHRIAAIHERATYAGTVDRRMADEAVALVDELRAATAAGWLARAT